MGGHNKWSQIKRQKGANDAAKSKVWAKLSRRITVESKKAGGDATAASVRAVVETAKKENMPKDAIERAIVKGTGADAGEMEAITYEAYGPGGAAIIIETLTDSRNRTAAEIKHLLSENGLALASPVQTQHPSVLSTLDQNEASPFLPFSHLAAAASLFKHPQERTFPLSSLEESAVETPPQSH
jgi:transcriptional/translational regulatory protein YebC/TACO1